MSYELIRDLKEQVSARKTIAIVGAGVSMGATGNAPASSWGGLLELGIDRCVGIGVADEAWADRQRAALEGSSLHDTLEVASAVSGRLGFPNHREWIRWLEETVGTLRANETSSLAALAGLGVRIATTNYDELIEQATGLSPVTWREPDKVLAVLREERDSVIHLHGHWDDADSVVLGIRSYEQVLGASFAQALQQGMGLFGNLLFIGCGEGLIDPNFAALCDFLAKHPVRHRHFRLERDDRVEAVRTQHANDGIYLVGYGPTHGGLADFLKGLAPAASTPAPTPPKPMPMALPARPPRCLGRETEVEAVVEAMLAGEPTPVLGTAGIGKSTVCLEALYDPRVIDRFGERRVFVRLDGALTANDMLAAVAETLGLEKRPDLGPILANLSAAPTALALDNLETPWRREIGATEAALGQLSGVPGVMLVVTVRAETWPEGVAFRRRLRVQPLRDRLPQEMFLKVTQSKHIDDPNLDALMGELDGVPLAIELMARVAKAEPSLDTLLQRWRIEKAKVLDLDPDDRLLSLSTSLNLTIDHPPMTDAARQLLALLAVLPDGIAHADLCSVGSDAVFGAATTLRDVALAYDEADRLRTLAPIREHVAGMRPPEGDDLDRALEHYLGLARQHAPKVGKEEGAEAAAKLAPEAANVERLILLGLDRPDPTPAIKVAIAFVPFQRISGLGTADPITRAGENAATAGHDRFASIARLNRGLLASTRSDHDAARNAFTEARTLFERSGDAGGEGDCAFFLGTIALARSEHDAAKCLFEEAMPLFRQVGGEHGVANCLHALGDIALERSDHHQARQRYEDALLIYRHVGAVLGEANCIQRLGHMALERSDYDQARQRFTDALPLFRTVGDVQGEANCIKGLGDIALDRSDHDQARQRYGEALPVYRQVGAVMGEANCILRLGDIALARSGHGQARQRYEEALSLYRRVGDVLGEANCILRLGETANAEGDPGEARRLHEEALGLYQRIQLPYSIGSTHLQLARLAEGDERAAHVAAAREAWASIGFDHRIKQLDQEFGSG